MPVIRHRPGSEPGPAAGTGPSFTPQEGSVTRTVLTPEDVLSFRRDGYLVKRNILDRDGCRRAVNRMWSCLPASFDRERWWTWRGKLTDCDGTMRIRERRGRFKIRDEVWFEPEWLELLPLNPFVRAATEQLLGAGTVATPKRVRGIYAVFPVRTLLKRRRHNGHIDRPLFNLGMIAYLDDVEPGGGGFHVWPGSHRILYHDFLHEFGEESRPSLAQHKAELRRNWPVEITGRAGDVIFYHYRILHGPGRNRGSRVRVAMLSDIRRKDYESMTLQPTDQDMWKSWNGVSQT